MVRGFLLLDQPRMAAGTQIRSRTSCMRSAKRTARRSQRGLHAFDCRRKLTDTAKPLRPRAVQLVSPPNGAVVRSIILHLYCPIESEFCVETTPTNRSNFLGPLFAAES